MGDGNQLDKKNIRKSKVRRWEKKDIIAWLNSVDWSIGGGGFLYIFMYTYCGSDFGHGHAINHKYRYKYLLCIVYIDIA